MSSQIKRPPLSDRIFANSFSEENSLLKDIKKDLLEANMPILARNYLSRVFFFTILSIFLGIGFGIGIFFLIKNLIVSILLTLLIPVGVFFLSYAYPSLTKGSTVKKINEELPFVTIHLAAISSSDLEPTKMFRLISNSKEYPAIGIEMKKVVNQIDLYGYNLTAALNNVAKSQKSEKLAELFSGIAINISSGGSLKNYLEKKAENLLIDYRLDRQRYNSLAETSMDIYISLLITAPLILVIVFVVMSTTGFQLGLSLNMLNAIVVSLIAILNIIFLVVINIKQPKG